MPPASWTEYALARMFGLHRIGLPAGSLGMSSSSPVTLNFQPWYTQRSPPSSLRPKNSSARRCGQCASSRPTFPLESRKATKFSPISRTRTGGQSGAGSSSHRSAGCQNCRNRPPMAVPGPTRVRISLFAEFSMFDLGRKLLAVRYYSIASTGCQCRRPVPTAGGAFTGHTYGAAEAKRPETQQSRVRSTSGRIRRI